jgi:hypothetical protein
MVRRAAGLRKLPKAVVDVSYDLVAERVHIKFANAGAGIAYEVQFDRSQAGAGGRTNPKSSARAPLIWGPGTRVFARLTSTDEAVIDGSWQEPDPGMADSFAPPGSPGLVRQKHPGKLK